MTTRKILTAAALLAAVTAPARAQNPIERVLAQIEANNLTLQAQESYVEAEQLAERVGNSLPDPEVGYEHLWGRSGDGQQGEFTAVQSFDFPTAYAARNKLARLRGKQHSLEYDIVRRQVMLEAWETCVEVIALRRGRALLETRSGIAETIAAAAQKKLETGEANALQASEARVRHLETQNLLLMKDMEIAEAMGRLRELNGSIGVDFTADEFPPCEALAPFDEMLETYRANDPVFLLALAGKDAARQEVRASRSESLPKLALGYKLEHGGGERFNGVVAGMSIPVFGNRHNVKRARAMERYSELEAAGAAVSSEQRLRTLYDRARLLEDVISRHAEIAENTSEYIARLSAALEAGETSITDYFAQYDAVIDFEEELIGFVREYHIVRGRIYSVAM